MKKNVSAMMILLLSAVLVILGSNLINGLLWGILREWYFDVARTSLPEWEWLYGGAKFVASAKTALIHLVLVAVWFGTQLLALLKSKVRGIHVAPMAVAVILWLASEVMHGIWGNKEPMAYILCTVSLHFMFGAWVAWSGYTLGSMVKEKGTHENS